MFPPRTKLWVRRNVRLVYLSLLNKKTPRPDKAASIFNYCKRVSSSCCLDITSLLSTRRPLLNSFFAQPYTASTSHCLKLLRTKSLNHPRPGKDQLHKNISHTSSWQRFKPNQRIISPVKRENELEVDPKNRLFRKPPLELQSLCLCPLKPNTDH